MWRLALPIVLARDGDLVRACVPAGRIDADTDVSACRHEVLGLGVDDRACGIGRDVGGVPICADDGHGLLRLVLEYTHIDGVGGGPSRPELDVRVDVEISLAHVSFDRQRLADHAGSLRVRDIDAISCVGIQ